MENVGPPSPQIMDGKMARFCPLRGFILDFGGGEGRGDGGLLFNFILSRIVVCYTAVFSVVTQRSSPLGLVWSTS